MAKQAENKVHLEASCQTWGLLEITPQQTYSLAAVAVNFIMEWLPLTADKLEKVNATNL